MREKSNYWSKIKSEKHRHAFRVSLFLTFPDFYGDFFNGDSCYANQIPVIISKTIVWGFQQSENGLRL